MIFSVRKKVLEARRTHALIGFRAIKNVASVADDWLRVLFSLNIHKYPLILINFYKYPQKLNEI